MAATNSGLVLARYSRKGFGAICGNAIAFFATVSALAAAAAIIAPRKPYVLGSGALFVLILVKQRRYIYAGAASLVSVALYDRRILYVQGGRVIFIGPRFQATALSNIDRVEVRNWERAGKSYSSVTLHLADGGSVTQPGAFMDRPCEEIAARILALKAEAA